MDCWWWSKKDWIDVCVDIDDTLLYSPGSIKLGRSPITYRLAHGAIEFLAALDRIPQVRISLYSAGTLERNNLFGNWLVLEAKNRGLKLKKKLSVYTVADGSYGKKKLKGLRLQLNLNRAVLVDDIGGFSEVDERRNLLKVYRYDEDAVNGDMVYKARVRNNLVRALGMILRSIQTSEENSFCSVVDALVGLQWEGNNYRHESSNSMDVYVESLQAMKEINPSFQIFESNELVEPWSQPDDANLFHSNIYDYPVDKCPSVYECM